MNDQKVKALCNTTRLGIISCLGTKQKTVSELIANCMLSQSAVSQHLTKLKNAGLVTTNRNGREIYYSLTDNQLSKISKLLLNLFKE